MSGSPLPQPRNDSAQPPFPLLERITALVLLAVLAALGWILIDVYEPSWTLPVSIATQVVILVVLLTAALLLVSIVALLHTRS